MKAITLKNVLNDMMFVKGNPFNNVEYIQCDNIPINVQVPGKPSIHNTTCNMRIITNAYWINFFVSDGNSSANPAQKYKPDSKHRANSNITI